jgi:oleandomycin transport system permease protein
MTTLAHNNNNTTTTTTNRPAVSLATRVGPLAALRHALTIAWRSLVQIRHNPMELADLSVQPLMFVLLFAYVFGGAMAGSPKAYLQFGLAGIICQNALFLTMNTGMALNTDITKGVFDRFRSLPIARSAPLLGRIAADVVRQVWSVAILLGVGLVLGFRLGTNPVSALGAVALLVAFVLAFSWLPVLVGMLVDQPEKVMMLGFVVVFPMTFASSAFVPVATMPGWLQAWVKVNPTSLLVDAVRGLLVGGKVAAPALGALAWAAAIAVVFAPLALRAFRRRTS